MYKNRFGKKFNPSIKIFISLVVDKAILCTCLTYKYMHMRLPTWHNYAFLILCMMNTSHSNKSHSNGSQHTYPQWMRMTI